MEPRVLRLPFLVEPRVFRPGVPAYADFSDE